MNKIFSVIWLVVRDAFRRKSENPDEPYVKENFEEYMKIAKQREPKTFDEFKDK